MTAVREQLIQLVGQRLFHTPTDAQLTGEILREAKRHAVSGLVDPAAKGVYFNSIRIQQAHAALAEVLEGIGYVIIKGCASAAAYPEPLSREMGDVDFLVDAGDIPEVDRRLRAAGYAPDHETDMHRCYSREGISYEMHNFAVSNLQRNAEIRSMLADTIQTAVPLYTQDGAMPVPDPFHNGLICLLHIINHLSSSGIGLRHFCDWACFVAATDDFEAIFRERLQRVGLWEAARIFSLTAVRYLGMPYRTWMGDADPEAEELLMEDIMLSGNVGATARAHGVGWIAAGRGFQPKRFAEMLNDATRSNFPAVRRCVLLYPLGWVCTSFIYLFRLVNPKYGGYNVKKMLSDAKNTNKLIKTLELCKYYDYGTPD